MKYKVAINYLEGKIRLNKNWIKTAHYRREDEQKFLNEIEELEEAIKILSKV